MAVRRIEVGAVPVRFALPLVVWVGNAQCGDDPLKRGEELPMIGSIRVLAGLLRGGSDLRAGTRTHSSHSNRPCRCSNTTMANAFACHGSRNAGASESRREFIALASLNGHSAQSARSR